MTRQEVGFRVVAGVGGLALLALLGGPALDAVDVGFRDRALRSAARAMPVEDVPVLIVEIDDRSVQQLGRFPWSRGRFAELTRVLHAGGASAIAVDVLFVEPADSSGDAAFVRAVADAGMVVLASAQAAGTGTARFLEPPPALAAAAGGVGHITVREDPDGTLRRYPFLLPVDGGVYPSLAYALLEVAGAERVDVPLAGDGTLAVNYASMSPSSLERHSFVDALAWTPRDAAAAVRGRAVIVATNFTGGVDVGPTPLGPRTPSSYVHAYALQTVLSGRVLRDAPAWLPLFLAAALLALLHHPLILGTPVRTALGVVTAAALVTAGCWALLRWGGYVLPPAYPAAAALLFGATHGLAEWRSSLEGRRRAESFLRRFVGTKMDRRITRGAGAELHSQRAEVTVMFCDLCDFTAFANRAEADQVVDVLRTFGQDTLDTISTHGGVVDKLLGDGIMAFWGFPDHPDDHARQAVQAALAVQLGMDRVNEALAARGVAPFQVRVGLATGQVTVGEIGGDVLADFTVIGRHVNLAARLQASAPPGGILLSQPTWNQAGDAVGSWVERQEPLTVRGFDEPLVTYLVWARRPVIGLAPYRRLEGQSPLA